MIFLKKYIFPIICIILLIIIFLQRSCESNKSKTDKVNIIIQYDTIFKPSETKTKTITKYITLKGKEILIPGKIDTVEIKVFEKAVDTTKLNMFINATKIRQYTTVFNDSVADVSIFTETKGELLKIVPTVKVKLVNKVETVFALYGGLNVYNNLQLENPGVQVNLGIQNKKGDIYTAGYDTNKSIFVGYSFRFINIKK